MSQPVKLSDKLILDARITSGYARRYIAGQIEFWAGIGKAIEALLRSPELEVLQKVSNLTPLSKALAQPGTRKGNARVAEILRTQPYPHYEPASDTPGFLVRIEEDGTRTVGRFVQRQFVAKKSARKR